MGTAITETAETEGVVSDTVTVTFTRAEYDALMDALPKHSAIRYGGHARMPSLKIADLQSAHERLEEAARYPVVSA